ncbi:MAG: class I SAM-dependent methyltransferase [Anaerolineaceae bacterium]
MDVLRPTESEALTEWARRVRANRDQADRVREAPERPDFYAPVAASFKADPKRKDEEALNFLLSLVQSEDRWLDIGAGGGRYTFPLALASREVVALDPSQGMLTVLREGIAEHEIRNVRIVQSRWPAAEGFRVDACLISHIGYDIEAIGPFLDAMEESAERLCVAILLARSPAFVAEPYWPIVHGEERSPLPALREFLALQLARGRICEVRLSQREAGWYRDDEAALGFLRQQLFVEPGGVGDTKLRAAVAALPHHPDGRVPSSTEPVPLGIVSWRPK